MLLFLQWSGYRNDDFPWLYTQSLQKIEGANVCIVLGKWVCPPKYIIKKTKAKHNKTKINKNN